MGKKLRMLTVVSCLIIAFACSNVVAWASTADDLEMDNLDILIVAHYFLTCSNTANSWANALSDVEIVPLYNVDGKIVCYYVELKEGEYAVVNNNITNPTVIEFGEGNNPLIRDILNQKLAPHIIYNSPQSIYDYNDKMTMKSKVKQCDIYENYPDLQEPNIELMDMLCEQKNKIVNRNLIMPYGDGNYGFIEWGDMPSGNYSSYNIPYLGTSWVTTGDFSDIAKNHCGATAVTNLAMYFANRGYSNLKKNSNRQTFIAVHDIVGNGPVMTIAGKAREYFSNCGYTLNYKSVSDFNGIKSATKKGRPCGILLADGVAEWHWILSVGYREYDSGNNYIRIMDGWNRNVNRFYKPGAGSLWISATEYWVE